MRTLAITTAGLTLLLLTTPAAAQVVREGGVESVAGSLGDAGEPYDEYTFKSAGGEILFASVDALVYVSGEEAGHGEEDVSAAAEEEPGGGCGEEGGPARICLQVVDEQGQVLCWATRPKSPGWQRDPRLACALPGDGNGRPADYGLRVTLADESCGDTLYPVPGTGEPLPYLLNVSLRRVAPVGALAPAIAASRNRL